MRTGGPAIGFAPVSSYVYTDDSITFGYANTEAQVLSYEDAPLLSVVAPLEINPQMIMWDPDTYPDVKSIADLGEAGITINVFGGGVFLRSSWPRASGQPIRSIRPTTAPRLDSSRSRER